MRPTMQYLITDGMLTQFVLTKTGVQDFQFMSKLIIKEEKLLPQIVQYR
jgi:hypothetical protein